MNDHRPILNYHRPERRKSLTDLGIVGVLALLLAVAYVAAIAFDFHSRSHRPPLPFGKPAAVGPAQSNPGAFKAGDVVVVVRPFPATQPDAP